MFPLQVVSTLSAGGGLHIIHLVELDSLDPILNFDDVSDKARLQMPSMALNIHFV
jgi:hypothetical protein